ncbi:DNA -binding domain-containing protein [Xanthobacter sp.]|uniref:DNA -binding domain-containing protein n=1 Tax=Xanthobacter sp. TaxID=35809 RepID=UPI0035B4B32E
MVTKTFEDTAPTGSELTDYDRAHIKLYARLLDATADGADWEEIASVLFGIDAARQPERARHVHDSHLARARWVASSGYKDLLNRPV